MLRRLFVAALLVLSLAVPASARAQSTQRPVRVFAASSLTDALNELGDAYVATGHERPIFNYAASSTLARQIEQGANADIFISADEQWMDYLAERGLVDVNSRVSLLSNRLVLVTPADRSFSIQIRRGFRLHRALRGGRLAMADPDSVPAGRYGMAALRNLGVWTSVRRDVVRAENVRTALRFVETGEAAAGIVYLTDARASSGVSIAGVFPEASHPRISYPMAVVRGGGSQAASVAAFLQSAQADAVFTRLGFILQ